MPAAPAGPAGAEALEEETEKVEPALAAAKASADRMQKLYWENKDLAACLAEAQAAIGKALEAAGRIEATDPEAAKELRYLAKAMTYDVASFTWPGWGEPDIRIGPEERALGRQAADTNLRMAVDLKRGPLPESRAYWLVGAHRLAAGELERAHEAFVRAEEKAAVAEAEADRLLAQGYARLTERLAQPDSPEAARRFEQAQAQLFHVEDGKALVEQLETAKRVFASP